MVHRPLFSLDNVCYRENDRVVMVNAVSMDNVEHAYAVQQLRKSGKNAKIVSLGPSPLQILVLVKKAVIFGANAPIICLILDHSSQKEGANPRFTVWGQRDDVGA